MLLRVSAKLGDDVLIEQTCFDQIEPANLFCSDPTARQRNCRNCASLTEIVTKI
jgi:hypothetical protein